MTYWPGGRPRKRNWPSSLVTVSRVTVSRVSWETCPSTCWVAVTVMSDAHARLPSSHVDIDTKPLRLDSTVPPLASRNTSRSVEASASRIGEEHRPGCHSPSWRMAYTRYDAPLGRNTLLAASGLNARFVAIDI